MPGYVYPPGPGEKPYNETQNYGPCPVPREAELNPQEHVWGEVREKEFPNRAFADLGSEIRLLETGFPRLG